MPTVTRNKPPARKPINSKKPAVRASVPPKKPAGASNGKLGRQSGLEGTPPTTIFMYGPSGVGKTSIWAYLPDVGFLFDPKEEGIKDLVDFKEVPEPKHMEMAEDFEGTLSTLADIANQEWNIKNLVLDSATGFELMCFQYHCAEFFNNDWSKEGFYAFQQGPKNAAKTDWPRFLDALDDVRRSGISVFLIGHSQVKGVANPDGENYDQHIPYLDKETWQQTHRWAKAVLFYQVEIGLERKGQKVKAIAGSEERCIYTQLGSTFNAKNRWGMEARIDAGSSPEEAYNNFIKAYLKAANK